MIRNTTQNWTPGRVVSVGFLRLEVVRAVPTPGDFAPDAYILRSQTSAQLYRFVPHNGIQKITAAEALPA